MPRPFVAQEAQVVRDRVRRAPVPRRRATVLRRAREDELRQGFAEAGVDVLELATDDTLMDAVMRFADLRKRVSQLSGGGMPRHLAGMA